MPVPIGTCLCGARAWFNAMEGLANCWWIFGLECGKGAIHIHISRTFDTRYRGMTSSSRVLLLLWIAELDIWRHSDEYQMVSIKLIIPLYQYLGKCTSIQDCRISLRKYEMWEIYSLWTWSGHDLVLLCTIESDLSSLSVGTCANFAHVYYVAQ